MADGTEGTADPRLEARGELSMALLAVDSGDLGHGAEHVARALVYAPALPEAHELLARLAVHPEGGAELFPLPAANGSPVSLGTVVARAHTLAVLGRPGDALPLLVSAQRHSPDGRWADAAWMYDPNVAWRIGPEAVEACALRLAQVVPEPPPEERSAAIAPYLALVRSTVAAFPGHAGLLWTASVLLRRSGDAAAGADLALRSEAARPSFHAATAAGYAFRAQQRWQDAEDAWIRALGFEPRNVALHTDIGELLASAGRPRDGLSWIERGLSIDPQHPGAFATARGLRFRIDGELHHLVELADHLRDHPGSGHGDRVLAHGSQSRWWLGPIPPASESVVNALHQVLDDDRFVRGAGLSLTVSAPEPPSALLAFQRALPGSEVAIASAPQPDPRLSVPEAFARGPIHTVGLRLWSFAGPAARPAVAPPSEQAAAAVRGAATYPWRHLPGAYDDAVRLSGLPLRDLLGLLVHPPEPLNEDPIVWPAWIRRVQAWACLGIAHHRGDEPWIDSTRRSVLVDLAYGPDDWTCEAALLALAATAWTQPGPRSDIAELVAWRFLAALEAERTRPVTILDSLAHLVLATPGVHADIASLAREALTRPGGTGGTASE